MMVVGFVAEHCWSCLPLVDGCMASPSSAELLALRLLADAQDGEPSDIEGHVAIVDPGAHIALEDDSVGSEAELLVLAGLATRRASAAKLPFRSPQVLQLARAGKAVKAAKRAAERAESAAKRARHQLEITRALAGDAASAAGLARAPRLDPPVEARLAIARAFGRIARSDTIKAKQQSLAAKRVAACAHQLQQRSTLQVLRRGVPEASRVAKFYCLEWDTTKQRARVRHVDQLPGETTSSATTSQTILVQHGLVGQTWWSEHRRVSLHTPHVVQSMQLKCASADFYLEGVLRH